jgi:hypothetical protein
MIKEIKTFRIANTQGHVSAIRSVEEIENLYEADFIFDIGTDICSYGAQDLIDYVMGLNLQWRLVVE